MGVFPVILDLLTDPQQLLLIAVGTFAGIAIGAIPGLTGAMLISLTLPLTFTMDYLSAMVLLVSMYVGSISGGLITATLLRMPGTPASMMTTLDGFPMASRGEPDRALGLGIVASFIGGMVSWGFLVLLSRPMADLSMKLGPFEFFSLVLMAMALIAAVSGKSLLRGLFSGVLGLIVALPGIDPATFEPRWTLGLPELNAGFQLLPVLIGLFAIAQVFEEIVSSRKAEHVDLAIRTSGLWLDRATWGRQAGNMLRSSLIGTWVGILPGIGANIGSLIAYATARNLSRKPDEFGEGAESGIVASESANNATVGGALIPLVALGIPGSVIDAILLGALVIHGLQPGPLLFQYNPDVVYTIMAAMLLANIAMAVLMIGSVRWLSRLVMIPRAYLLPAILVFCVVGSFALSNRMFDVWVMLAAGGLGVLMQRYRIPVAPFVIGVVLGPIAEDNLVSALMQSGGSFLPLFSRPVSVLFLTLAALLVAWPVLRSARQPDRA